MRSRRFDAPQGGITLVEALVALVVLSVGMLGIASLYVASLRANRNALLRTQAVNLVNDMADRIRANGSARIAYKLSTYGGAPTKRGCVITGNCLAASLAEDDLAWWVAAVTGSLPNAAADVAYTPAAGTGLPDTYVITTRWTEAGDPQPQQYQTNLQLIAVTP